MKAFPSACWAMLRDLSGNPGRGIVPDIVTDQTTTHRSSLRLRPGGLQPGNVQRMRRENPENPGRTRGLPSPVKWRWEC